MPPPQSPTHGGGGAFDAAANEVLAAAYSPERVVFEKKLRVFYARHNPEKLGDLTQVPMRVPRLVRLSFAALSPRFRYAASFSLCCLSFARAHFC